ncbi:MAG: RNA-binding cell elongation regulator Jag/EloR [Acidimicrobiales bacterium]
MEWVETTGKTVDEAKDAALDQLGVDEQDAEFEVIDEPRTGLFGRTRGEARVRARVRPTKPRPKVERRDRKGRTGGGRGGKSGGRSRDASGPKTRAGGGGARAATTATVEADTDAPAGRKAVAAPKQRSQGGGRSGDRTRASKQERLDNDEEKIEMSETELVAQGEIVRGFLLDLLDAFGLDGDVAAMPAEEGAVELDVTGEDLGLLIGPKGQTLQAIQELSRSVLQRQQPGETHARIRVDVGGYRQRRREALARFVSQIADEVKASGVQKALEPMSPPDRKVVHDTVNDIDGVHTVSEGEDARRRVVILPDA